MTNVIISCNENYEVTYSIEGKEELPHLIKMLTTVVNSIVDELEDYDVKMDWDITKLN